MSFEISAIQLLFAQTPYSKNKTSNKTAAMNTQKKDLFVEWLNETKSQILTSTAKRQYLSLV